MESVKNIDPTAQISKIVDEVDRQLLSIPAKAHLFIKSVLTDLERDEDFFNNIFNSEGSSLLSHY